VARLQEADDGLKVDGIQLCGNNTWANAFVPETAPPDMME
jgi:hypothetical protein